MVEPATTPPRTVRRQLDFGPPTPPRRAAAQGDPSASTLWSYGTSTFNFFTSFPSKIWNFFRWLFGYETPTPEEETLIEGPTFDFNMNPEACIEHALRGDAAIPLTELSAYLKSHRDWPGIREKLLVFLDLNLEDKHKKGFVEFFLAPLIYKFGECNSEFPFIITLAGFEYRSDVHDDLIDELKKQWSNQQLDLHRIVSLRKISMMRPPEGFTSLTPSWDDYKEYASELLVTKLIPYFLKEELPDNELARHLVENLPLTREPHPLLLEFLASLQ